ncbi:hypothetical protein B0O80DRAFT_76244 [Mortierella sp. GBAus27b]|nr:hypothetical protein B0O80DRAFT_76244 [Mortierella sp. GBAus27b]
MGTFPRYHLPIMQKVTIPSRPLKTSPSQTSRRESMAVTMTMRKVTIPSRPLKTSPSQTSRRESMAVTLKVASERQALSSPSPACHQLLKDNVRVHQNSCHRPSRKGSSDHCHKIFILHPHRSNNPSSLRIGIWEVIRHQFHHNTRHHLLGVSNRTHHHHHHHHHLRVFSHISRHHLQVFSHISHRHLQVFSHISHRHLQVFSHISHHHLQVFSHIIHHYLLVFSHISHHYLQVFSHIHRRHRHSRIHHHRQLGCFSHSHHHHHPIHSNIHIRFGQIVSILSHRLPIPVIPHHHPKEHLRVIDPQSYQAGHHRLQQPSLHWGMLRGHERHSTAVNRPRRPCGSPVHQSTARCDDDKHFFLLHTTTQQHNYDMTRLSITLSICSFPLIP